MRIQRRRRSIQIIVDERLERMIKYHHHHHHRQQHHSHPLIAPPKPPIQTHIPNGTVDQSLPIIMPSIKNVYKIPFMIYSPSPKEEPAAHHLLPTPQPPRRLTFHFQKMYRPYPTTKKRLIQMLPIYPKKCM